MRKIIKAFLTVAVALFTAGSCLDHSNPPHHLPHTLIAQTFHARTDARFISQRVDWDSEVAMCKPTWAFSASGQRVGHAPGVHRDRVLTTAVHVQGWAATAVSGSVIVVQV